MIAGTTEYFYKIVLPAFLISSQRRRRLVSERLARYQATASHVNQRAICRFTARYISALPITDVYPTFRDTLRDAGGQRYQFNHIWEM